MIGEPTRLLLLGISAVLGGALNSVAGGGSLVTFPVCVALGFPAVTASATNTVAMTPGGIAAAFAYRRELGPRKRLAFAMALPGALGGLFGALVLVSVPARVFEVVVPWLVAAATLVIVLQGRMARRAAARATASIGRKAVVVLGIALVAVYGGYFGAGVGIMLLSLLALLGDASIHELNAVKAVVNAAINGTAAGYLLTTRAVDYPAAAVMALGAVLGGFAGAALARRRRPEPVRWFVVAVGVALSVLFAVRYWT